MANPQDDNSFPDSLFNYDPFSPDDPSNLSINFSPQAFQSEPGASESSWDQILDHYHIVRPHQGWHEQAPAATAMFQPADASGVNVMGGDLSAQGGVCYNQEHFPSYVAFSGNDDDNTIMPQVGEDYADPTRQPEHNKQNIEAFSEKVEALSEKVKVLTERVEALYEKLEELDEKLAAIAIQLGAVANGIFRSTEPHD